MSQQEPITTPNTLNIEGEGKGEALAFLSQMVAGPSYDHHPLKEDSQNLQEIFADHLVNEINVKHGAMKRSLMRTPLKDDQTMADAEQEWLENRRQELSGLTTGCQIRAQRGFQWSIASVAFLAISTIAFNHLGFTDLNSDTRPDGLYNGAGITLGLLVAACLLCGANALKALVYEEIRRTTTPPKTMGPTVLAPPMFCRRQWLLQPKEICFLGHSWKLPYFKRAFRILPVTLPDIEDAALAHLQQNPRMFD